MTGESLKAMRARPASSSKVMMKPKATVVLHKECVRMHKENSVTIGYKNLLQVTHYPQATSSSSKRSHSS